MTNSSPTIYLLYGQDQYGIEDFLKARLKPKMGSGANAEMNITTLDGRSQSLEEIQAETHAVPFLSSRRMVVLNHPLAAAKGQKQQKKFLHLLESLPQTTALVLMITKGLKGSHWLVQWAQAHPDLTWSKSFSPRQGQAMVRWIQDQAQEQGGEFSPQAAQLLASYLDDNPRLAAGEIEKLLTYTDFSRPVTPEDVQSLTPDVRQGDVFAMVDAVGRGRGERASRMLHRLLEENDPLMLFGMIVRQFRLIIQVREALDEDSSLGHRAIADRLDEHPYPIKKILPQARQFTIDQVKAIYQTLSEIDQAIKTGGLNAELALDVLIAALTKGTETPPQHA